MRNHRLSNIALAIVMFVSIGLAMASFIALGRGERGSYGMSLEWRSEGTGGEQALTVTSVSAGSPAAKAGIEPGYLVVRFGSFADRILLALQGNLPLHSYVAVGQPVSFSFVRHISLEPLRLVAVPTPSENQPLWLYELRIAVYLLAALIVGALVFARPSAITWGFAVFVIFGMLPLAEPLEFFGLVASPTTFLASMIVLYVVNVGASLGLIVFAVRFPRGTPPPEYVVVERIAIVLALVAAGIVVEATLGKLWGWPALDAGFLEFVRALLFSLIAVTLLAVTYARTHGNDRVRLAWAIVGPSVGTLCIVADHWCYSQGYETAATAMGLLSSIAPFSMMYAILRHRVIDVRLPLAQRFAETVVSVEPSTGGKPDRRELVRRAALLLSADLPFHETLGQFAALLAAFVDANSVLIAVGDRDRARLEYHFEDGQGCRPDESEIPLDSLTAGVLRSGQPLLIKTDADWPNRLLVSVGGKPTQVTQSALFVPVAFGGSIVGAISVQSLVSGAYDENDLQLLESCALYLGARIHDEEAKPAPPHSSPLMEIDGPTGLTLAPIFDMALERQWQRCRAEGKSVGVLLLDVDLFDAFTEAYGTPAADTCLRQIARVVREKIAEPECVAARYGDDCFAVLLPGQDLEAAIALAEALRSGIQALNVPHQGSSLGTLSISVGAAAGPAAANAGASSLVQEARTELDAAKAGGRNRVAARWYRPNSPSASRRAVVRTNLSLPGTTFYGRNEDMAAIEEALVGHPVVIVAGPAGIGKTRLLLEIGSRSLESHSDGVWYVDLAKAETKDAIAQSVAATLVRRGQGDADAIRLSDLLGEKNVLLLLDNGDHLAGACERFAADLAGRAAGVRILVAANEGESGGWTYQLPPLPIEDSVALYLDRTRRAFGANGQGVIAARVVERLDRIPVAIELAATLPELPPMLTAEGDRPQSRIVQRLLDWTYESLTADEATVLRRVAIFDEDWTVQAATAVSSDGTLSAETVAAAIGVLESRTLLTRSEGESPARYRIAEKARVYARAMLRNNDDVESVADRHVRYFASYARSMTEGKTDFSFAEWSRLQRAEFPNYRAALRRALRGAADYAAAAAIVRSLVGMLETAFGSTLANDLKLALRSDALGTEDQAAFWLALSEITRPSASADSLRAARRSYELYRDAGDERGMAYAIWQVAGAQVRVRGSIESGIEPALRAGVKSARGFGDRQLAVGLLRIIAYVCGEDSRHEDARVALRRAAELADRTDGLMLAMLVGSTALEEQHAANFDEAALLWRRAAALAEEGSASYAALCLINAGANELSRHDTAAARIVLQRGLTQLRALGHRYGQGLALSYFARLAKEAGDAERSARIAGFTETYFERGSARSPSELRAHDALVQELRAKLGHAAFERERGRGLWMSLDDAIAEAYAS